MEVSRLLRLGYTLTAVLVLFGCGGGSSTDENTVWDLVACSVDDEGFNTIDDDYAAQIDRIDGAESQVHSDSASGLGALAVRAEASENTMGELQARLDADVRVISTHRDSTVAAACFGGDR